LKQNQFLVVECTKQTKIGTKLYVACQLSHNDNGLLAHRCMVAHP